MYLPHLIISVFREPQPEGLEVCRKNGDLSDCRLVNLYWGTRAETIKAGIESGNYKKMGRKGVPLCLTKGDVSITYDSSVDAGNQLGVSSSALTQALKKGTCVLGYSVAKAQNSSDDIIIPGEKWKIARVERVRGGGPVNSAKRTRTTFDRMHMDDEQPCPDETSGSSSSSGPPHGC